MAAGGIEEQYTAFDHVNVFHESNLPKMVDTLLRWSGAWHPAGQPRTGQSAQTEVKA
jgi:hypothetical protein